MKLERERKGPIQCVFKMFNVMMRLLPCDEKMDLPYK